MKAGEVMIWTSGGRRDRRTYEYLLASKHALHAGMIKFRAASDIYVNLYYISMRTESREYVITKWQTLY